MNISLDQYLDGFERTARELPDLLARWESLDEDLRDEYSDQLVWLLEAKRDARQLAEGLGRTVECAQRLAYATAAIFRLRSPLMVAMGVTSESIIDAAIPPAPASDTGLAGGAEEDASMQCPIAA